MKPEFKFTLKNITWTLVNIPKQLRCLMVSHLPN